ncbi:SDR family oxidoreductase [Nocardia thailandica]|uniref:SDR family oxidoreductase n=1 Tax=Nocardia thailandica TaxID=257275 RepID=UPI0003184C10|nr:SDR family oxidoreductase [Nocardia thailandica]
MPRFEPHPVVRPAIVTGASSGIGAATAVALAELGHPVALGARRVPTCEALAARIRDKGGVAFAHRLDVTDDDSVEEFVTAAEKELGDIEILVSAAGVVRFGAAHEMSSPDFVRQLDLHLAGPHRMVRRLVPGMVERQRGDVVLIGSDCALSPRPRMGAYNAAKSGLEALSVQMRQELEGTGVRVSMVRPGPTQTEMGTDATVEDVGPLLEDWSRWGFARHPYMLRASDMAAAVSAVVSTPRGAHIIISEVQPEAPLRHPKPAPTQQ